MTNRTVLELIGITRDVLIDTGLRLIEEMGVGRFTVDRICAAHAIKPGALFKFFEDFDEVHDALTARALAMLIEAHRGVDVDRTGRGALEAHALVERAFAQAHPSLYAVALRGPLSASAELAHLRRAYMGLMSRMLRGYDISPALAPELANGLSAALQGFIFAELAGRGRSGLEFDRNYERLLDMMDMSARAAAGRPVGLDVQLSVAS